jgi:hypothetical protein
MSEGSIRIAYGMQDSLLQFGLMAPAVARQNREKISEEKKCAQSIS